MTTTKIVFKKIEINVGPRKICGPKILSSKQNLVQQNFESEDILSPKNWSPKNVYVSKILGQKNVFQKN